MAAPAWRRPSAPSIPACAISAAGCTRCGIFWRRPGSAITRKSKPEPKPSIALPAEPRPKPRFVLSGARWRRLYPTVVRQLERDLPELLSFFAFPRHLWRKLRTTNVIERCFVEVRRRTRPMVCFVNVESVDRIIYSIFQEIQPGMENPHPPPSYTSSLTSPCVIAQLTVRRRKLIFSAIYCSPVVGLRKITARLTKPLVLCRHL